MKFIFDTSHKPPASSDSTPADEAKDQKTKQEELEAMCPSCKKALSNNMLMFREYSHNNADESILIEADSDETVRTCCMQNMHRFSGQDVEAMRCV